MAVFNNALYFCHSSPKVAVAKIDGFVIAYKDFVFYFYFYFLLER